MECYADMEKKWMRSMCFHKEGCSDAFLSKKCKWQDNMSDSMISFLWKQTFTKYTDS